MAKKVVRDIMPAHPGGRFTVEELRAAWLRVFETTRSGSPKRKKRQAAVTDRVAIPLA
jgi:hypothetical protein